VKPQRELRGDRHLLPEKVGGWVLCRELRTFGFLLGQRRCEHQPSRRWAVRISTRFEALSGWAQTLFLPAVILGMRSDLKMVQQRTERGKTATAIGKCKTRVGMHYFQLEPVHRKR